MQLSPIREALLAFGTPVGPARVTQALITHAALGAGHQHRSASALLRVLSDIRRLVGLPPEVSGPIADYEARALLAETEDDRIQPAHAACVSAYRRFPPVLVRAVFLRPVIVFFLRLAFFAPGRFRATAMLSTRFGYGRPARRARARASAFFAVDSFRDWPPEFFLDCDLDFDFLGFDRFHGGRESRRLAMHPHLSMGVVGAWNRFGVTRPSAAARAAACDVQVFFRLGTELAGAA